MSMTLFQSPTSKKLYEQDFHQCLETIRHPIRQQNYNAIDWENLLDTNKINNLMIELTRITLNPEIMGGKPYIRGMRVTVGTIVGLLASGYSPEEILQAYPYLEAEDIQEALAYAAWRVEETEIPLITS